MKKILIVDDEPNILMSLEYALSKLNYAIFIARDGQEAIDIMTKNPPDLVLLDIMMPNVDGYETLSWIKNQDWLSHTKVFFLTAKSKPEDIEKGLSLGADQYIKKPFSIKNIIKKIDETIS